MEVTAEELDMLLAGLFELRVKLEDNPTWVPGSSSWSGGWAAIQPRRHSAPIWTCSSSERQLAPVGFVARDSLG